MTNIKQLAEKAVEAREIYERDPASSKKKLDVDYAEMEYEEAATPTAWLDMEARLEKAEAALKGNDWRQIPWAKPGYCVSRFGEVRSPKTILKTPYNRYGYKCVSIRMENGKIRFATVHGLVAAAFIGPRPEGLETAHMDGDKDNNTDSNLKYVSSVENHAHMQTHGVRAHGESHGRSKLTEAMVTQIRLEVRPGDREFGVKPLARKYGVDHATIRRAVKGVSWRAAEAYAAIKSNAPTPVLEGEQ